MRSAILASGLLAVFIVGCSANDNHAADNNGRDNAGMKVNDNDNHTMRTRNMSNINGNNTQDNNLQVDKKLARQVDQLKEVQRSTVVVVGNRAYVAAEINGKANELTDEVKQKISRSVKKADQDIKRVYVSADPEFIDRLKGYADDIQNGKPISGLFDEFTKTVNRVFPEGR